MKKVLLLLVCLLGLWLGISAGARHAYWLPDYGTLLNLVFPPDDMWVPLASAPVQRGIREYKFTIKHQYPGNHHVAISIPRQEGMKPLPSDFFVTLEIEEDGKFRRKEAGEGSSFRGIERQGANFCRYSFPKDVGLRENVVCRILIVGDMDSLLAQYDDVVVSIVKGSDK